MRLLPSLLFLLLCQSFTAQLTEGKITYSLYVEDDSEESEANHDMIENSTFELFFTPNKTRTSVQLGENMTMSTIIDSENKKGLILMTGIVGNLAVTASHEQLIQSNTSNEIEIEYLDATKEIQGFLCKKAKITKSNGTKITYWYTEEIKCNTAGIENMFSEIKGVPLELNIETDDSTIFYKAISIQKKLDHTDTLFSTTSPNDYKSITLHQFETGDF